MLTPGTYQRSGTIATRLALMPTGAHPAEKMTHLLNAVGTIDPNYWARLQALTIWPAPLATYQPSSNPYQPHRIGPVIYALPNSALNGGDTP